MRLGKGYLALLAALALGLCGCSGSSAPAKPPGVLAIESAQQRLLGSWHLVSFQPEQPFGPPFDQLVAEHVGRMTVTFEPTTLTTMNGFEVTRSYRIVSADGDLAKAIVMDDMNVEYDFDLTFQGQQLAFVSLTSPWRGHGLLGRSQAQP